LGKHKAGGRAAFLFCVIFAAKPFISASQNKVGGTGNIAEHEPSRFVVGAGKENT
jgi:hypothetical protein